MATSGSFGGPVTGAAPAGGGGEGTPSSALKSRPYRIRAPVREEIGGRDGHAELFRRAVGAGSDDAVGKDACHVREGGLRAVAKVDEVGVRERQVLYIAAAQLHPSDDQLAGVAIGKRPEQDRIGDAEDRRAGAHAEGDGEHGDSCEERISDQNAGGNSKGAQGHREPHCRRWLLTGRAGDVNPLCTGMR